MWTELLNLNTFETFSLQGPLLWQFLQLHAAIPKMLLFSLNQISLCAGRRQLQFIICPPDRGKEPKQETFHVIVLCTWHYTTPVLNDNQ